MQELEKILEEINEEIKSSIAFSSVFTEGLCRARNIIHKHMNDGWIPVREILPEDENMYLVTCCTKKGSLNVNRAYCIDGIWHGSGSMSNVITWQLLPEPYKAERSE